MVQKKLAEVTPEILRTPPLLTAGNLIRLGYEPAPRFTDILRAVEDALVEGALDSLNATAAFVKQKWPL